VWVGPATDLKPYAKRGWLQKAGDMNPAFKRRFFVLAGELLYYYRADTDRQPAGTILIQSAKIESVDKRRLHVLPQYCTRVFQILAANTAERDEWATELKWVAESRELAHHAESVQGVLGGGHTRPKYNTDWTLNADKQPKAVRRGRSGAGGWVCVGCAAASGGRAHPALPWQAVHGAGDEAGFFGSASPKARPATESRETNLSEASDDLLLQEARLALPLPTRPVQASHIGAQVRRRGARRSEMERASEIERAHSKSLSAMSHGSAFGTSRSSIEPWALNSQPSNTGLAPIVGSIPGSLAEATQPGMEEMSSPQHRAN
jgi:hypothetical protein